MARLLYKLIVDKDLFLFHQVKKAFQSEKASKENNFVRKAYADILNIKLIPNSYLFQAKIGKEDILKLTVQYIRNMRRKGKI